MASYRQKQEQLFFELEEKFKSGKIPSTIVPMQQDYGNSESLCLTVVVFLPQSLQQVITSKITHPLQEFDQGQYYYPADSLHLTIQNIRTVHTPALFTNEDIEKVRIVLRKSVSRYKTLHFDLQGILELPTSLAVQAFSDEAFADFVLHIRENLVVAGVPDNKQYLLENIVLGNVTVCRYTKISNEGFLEKVKELKEIEIGKLDVQSIFLITTNAVCHKSKTTIIEKFDLQEE